MTGSSITRSAKTAKTAMRAALVAATLVGAGTLGTATASAATVQPYSNPFHCTSGSYAICVGAVMNGNTIVKVEVQVWLPYASDNVYYGASANNGWSNSGGPYSNHGHAGWVDQGVWDTNMTATVICGVADVGSVEVASTCVNV